MMKFFKYSTMFFLVIAFTSSFAQHEMHQMPMAKDSMKMSMDTMQMPMEHKQMTSAFSPNLPMSRDGSGTSWQADDSPMMMHMKMKGKTSMMLHYAVFARYTNQDITNDGNRGAKKLDAPNWFMLMLIQKLSKKDLLSFHSMFSFDGLTEGKRGYPLLFQTGETAFGEPLVDRQHPHDLFAALAVNYTHSFSNDFDINTYFGYPGEPALGPPVFMHRPSAMNNPDAALGHHWQDATHITFGVGTLGIRYKKVKAEGSIFTGREPDENRFDFDKPRFDSYSGRLSFNPNTHYAFQVSGGYIKSPEELEPGTDVTRLTASMLHSKKISDHSFVASSIVWGMNHNSDGKDLHSVLLESNLKLMPLTVYGRFEWIQKDAHELDLHNLDNNLIYNIHVLTVGVNRSLFEFCKTELSIGAQGAINFSDEKLKTIYGKMPLSGEVFLKFAPVLFKAHVM